MRAKALGVLTAACVASSLAASTDDAHAGVKARKQHLIRRAKSELGTSYRYGGESARRGFDCSGYTLWTFKKKVNKVTISSVWDKYYYGPRFRGAVRVPQLRH